MQHPDILLQHPYETLVSYIWNIWKIRLQHALVRGGVNSPVYTPKRMRRPHLPADRRGGWGCRHRPPLLERARWMVARSSAGWGVGAAAPRWRRPRRAGALPAVSGPALEKASGGVFFCGETDWSGEAEEGPQRLDGRTPAWQHFWLHMRAAITLSLLNCKFLEQILSWKSGLLSLNGCHKKLHAIHTTLRVSPRD
jgi:hypothetical protein